MADVWKRAYEIVGDEKRILKVVRLKPPKIPKPEPPPEGYVIFISTDNGFDIDNHRAGDYTEGTKDKRKRRKRGQSKMHTMKKLMLAALVALSLAGCASESDRLEKINASGWSDATKDKVRSKKVTVGMTSEQVKLAFGEPSKVNRTVTASGVREQWIYGSYSRYTKPWAYLYLTNGRVTSWQD